MTVAINDNAVAEETVHIDESVDHARLLEALIFASERPLALSELQSFFPKELDIVPMLQQLQQGCEGRGFNLVELNGKWSFRTASDLAPYLKREKTVQRKLSRATIETLAIIAYHQPITRAEIEEIRGVSVAQGTLDILLQAGWVKPGKRRETPGRPLTWQTTDEFLQHFGIASVADLPGFDELKLAGLLDKNRPAPLFGAAEPNLLVLESVDDEESMAEEL
jgi:segregation and condensation protein B